MGGEEIEDSERKTSLCFLSLLMGIGRKHPKVLGSFLSHSEDSSYEKGVERENYKNKGENGCFRKVSEVNRMTLHSGRKNEP